MADAVDLALRLEALRRQRAVPAATHRRLAVRRHAIVLCPLQVAGEEATIQAVAIGRLGRPPKVYVVPDPRNRDQLYTMLRWIGRRLVPDYEQSQALNRAPQLLVQSASAVNLLGAVSERVRNSPDPDVARLGQLLAYATDRAVVAGQQAIHPATALLATHWATGQDPSEDEHLGVVLTWIDPPRTGDLLDALEAAEDEPMGVKTRPEFDDVVLEPLMRRYNRAKRQGLGAKVLRARRAQIRTELTPVVTALYNATQRAIAVYRATRLPPLPSLGALVAQEDDTFLRFMEGREAGMPVLSFDTPIMGVWALARNEAAEAAAATAIATEDGIGRARAVLTGEFLAGTVRQARRVARAQGRGFDDVFEVETAQRELRLRTGDELCWADDPRLAVLVTAMATMPRGGSIVTCRVTMGMRAVGAPASGDVLTLVPGVVDDGRVASRMRQMKVRLAPRPWTHDPRRPAPTPIPRAPALADPARALDALR